MRKYEIAGFKFVAPVGQLATQGTLCVTRNFAISQSRNSAILISEFIQEENKLVS